MIPDIRQIFVGVDAHIDPNPWNIERLDEMLNYQTSGVDVGIDPYIAAFQIVRYPL